MLALSFSAAIAGIDAHVVRVETDSAAGVPAFAIVGLPDRALNESLETALLVAFVLAALYVMRPLFARFLDAVHEASATSPPTAIAGGLTLLFLAAVTTSAIGVFPAFGVRRRRDRIRPATLRRAVVERRRTVRASVLRAHLLLLHQAADRHRLAVDAGRLDVVRAAAHRRTTAKFGTAALISRFAGLPLRHALSIGAMMNTKGLVELVAINLGYEMGVIPRSVYTVLVLIAVISTAATAPVLRMLLAVGLGESRQNHPFGRVRLIGKS
jgi:hypothetical protein